MTDNDCNQCNKKSSNNVGDSISLFIIVTAWIAGVVLSPPGKLIYAAIFFPPYAWYLLIERVMKVTGLI